MPAKILLRCTKVVLPALLMLLGHTTRAEIIYDATGGINGGGDLVTAVGPILADRFVVPFSGTLSSISLNLALPASPVSGFTVDLFADAGAAGVGAATFIATVADTALTSSFALLTVMPTTPITLDAGVTYYAGIQDPTVSSGAQFGFTIDPAVLARLSVISSASYYNTTGGVQPNSGGPYELSVSETPVPEPLSIAVLAVGLGTLGLAKRYAA